MRHDIFFRSQHLLSIFAAMTWSYGLGQYYWLWQQLGLLAVARLYFSHPESHFRFQLEAETVNLRQGAKLLAQPEWMEPDERH